MAPAPYFDDLFIVPEPGGEASEPHVLAVPSAGGWTLPRWIHAARHGRPARELDDPFWPAAIQRELRRQLAIDVSVLHGDLYDERDADIGDRRTVFVVECQNPDWSPPAGARWVGRSDLAALPLRDDVPGSALAAWFAEAEDRGRGAGQQDGRPPWQRPGWLAMALAWVHQEVERRDLSVTGPAEQLGTKIGRYLMRVPTTAGRVYFKAVPAMYAREAGILRLLATAAPGAVPTLLALDADRCWHLTLDAAGTSFAERQEIAEWTDALEVFGRLQVACADRIEALLAVGCTDLRLEAVVAQIEPLLADTAALQVGQPGGLAPAELDSLCRLVPRLRSACDRLVQYDVAPTLVHGDFLPENIAVADGRPVFFDWCEATVSHPFFSAIRFLASARWHGRFVRDDPALYARLRDAYLGPWADREPSPRLLTAFELARAIQPLQHALTYWHLLRLLVVSDRRAGDRWERRTVIAASLRRLLEQRLDRP
jgi:hypothetical protein